MRLLDSPLTTGVKTTGAEGAVVALLWSTLLCGEAEEGTTTKKKKKKSQVTYINIASNNTFTHCLDKEKWKLSH